MRPPEQLVRVRVSVSVSVSVGVSVRVRVMGRVGYHVMRVGDQCGPPNSW